MELGNVKEKFIHIDVKTKVLIFLGIVLLGLVALPKSFFVLLGVLALLAVTYKRIGNVFSYIFKSIFGFIAAAAILLVILYFVMLAVVYFFV